MKRSPGARRALPARPVVVRAAACGVGLALLLGAAGTLAPPGALAADPPKTEDEKAIYALGLDLSQRLGNFQLSPREVEVLEQGLRDGLLGREPAVSLEEYGPRIGQLAEARAAQLASAEREASAAFLEKEAGEKGATRSESGLIMRVIREGSGPSPTADDTVEVHYHGTLRDGTVFDSSVDRGEPAVFPLNRIIPCWREALQSMQVGEKARVVCPAEIAYGDRGAPPKIKPGAALAFDVELLKIVE